MNLNPQEKYLLSLLSICKVSNSLQLEEAVGNLVRTGHKMPSFQIKDGRTITSPTVRTNIKSLIEKELIDTNLGVSQLGSDILGMHSRLPVKTVLYIQQKFGFKL